MKKYLQKSSILVALNMMLIAINSVCAQDINYPFDGNVNDVANNVQGTPLRWQNSSQVSNTPSYVATPSGGQGMNLAMNEYMQLDNSFNSLITSNDSFELEIDFQYTYTGPVPGESEGRKPIYGSKQVGNQSPGLVINAFRSSATTFDIYLGFSDGNEETVAFFIVNPLPLTINEEINISLKIDYEAKSWFFKANDMYNFDFFAESFDMDIFKNALQTIPAYIGWQQDHGFEMDFHGFNGTMIINHFKLHVPARSGDIIALQTALQEMTDHILGNINLTQAEIDAHTTTVIINHQNNYTNAQTEIDNYLAAFEANFDALFTNRDEAPSLSSLPNEERIAYFLIQDIFDNEFVAGNMANMAGMSFREGNIYPGPVSSTAPRVNNAQVAINSTYIKDPGIQLVDGNLGVIRPTGYYAAPGELITVTVPTALVNRGVKVIAGAHTDQSSLDGMRRFQRISKTIDITSTATQIVNPFGGALYFKIPQELNEGWQTVTIDGAVKSPYFRMVSGQPQNVSEWTTDLNNGYVKWADIESDTMMFTLPTSMIGSFDITAVMSKWNEMMDFIQMIAGRPSEPIRSEYVLADCIGGVGAAGYPKLMEENTYDAALPSTYWNPLRILEDNFVETNQGFIFHELGHNLLFPIPDGHVETVVQLYSIPAYYVLTNDVERSIRNVEDENLGSDGGAIAWMITPEFRNNTEMLEEHAKYQVRGGLKWIDIATLFSWEDVGKLNKFFYDKWTMQGGSPLGDTYVSYAEYLQAATERINVNMTPLLNFWGMIPTSAEINTYASYSQNCDIYDRLVYYRNLVPLTQSDFSPWKDLLLAQVDPYHHAEINDIYTNYDTQNIGAQIIAQIDYLLATYYPNGACQTFQNDVSLRAINSPNDSEIICGDISPQLQVRNNGINDISVINISYGVTGGETHNYTWNGMLSTDEETKINLPSISVGAGNFTLNVETAIANDENNANDNLSLNFSVNTSGYFNVINSFENATDNLIVQNGVWERGVPSGNTLNNAATGTRVYGTNLNGNYPSNANASLQSNCYDFTQIIDPVLTFQMAYILETDWDWANVQYSIDGGQTWENLGSVNSQPNWYNSNNDGNGYGCPGCPGAQWTGSNPTMTQYAYDFTQNAALGETDLTAEDNIMFRMTLHSDDIINREGIVIDDFVVEGKEPIEVSPKVFLQGAFLNPNVGEETLMRDDLRVATMIPTQSPYADKLICRSDVFDTTGNDAIVDWVWIELRDATDNTNIIASQSALLQRDGDVVNIDGISTISFLVPEGDYHIAIKHRNHLGIMTNTSVTFLEGMPTIVDFTEANNQNTFGTNAQTDAGMPTGKVGMWAGNMNDDIIIQYSGTSPDTPIILSTVLNDAGNFLNFPTYVVNGYTLYDVNLDGKTQYSGITPDSPFIIQNVLAHPGNFLNFSTYQIQEQLPEN